MGLLAVLLLAAGSFDGAAALRHASALSSLGPHPWGSPRGRAAAAYVAAELRGAGLSDVRLEEFEVKGVRGTNVVGALAGSGPGLIVVGAHHDTAPDAPGAYDDGGGVGVMIEVARALAHGGRPARSIVFASFDGEEAWSTGLGTTTGSRAYLRALGPQARDITAAFVVEMCGWPGGTPVLHPVAYADPLRPEGHVIAPGWVVEASLAGARAAGGSFGVGDPWLSWVYQPAVRTFRVRLYGDDVSFLQAGVPAVFASDSSFTGFYPWYHQARDTADRLDAAALARMGQAVLGAVQELIRVPLSHDPDTDWFAAFGRVAPRWALLLLAAAAVAPGLASAAAGRGWRVLARLGLSALFAVLAWQDPVPALWVLAAPVAVSGLTPRRGPLGLALVPAVLLLVLGGAAWARGMAQGTWLPLWHRGAFVAALALSAIPAFPQAGRSSRAPARAAARSSRRGLPRSRAAG
jgi:hypothetical protein